MPRARMQCEMCSIRASARCCPARAGSPPPGCRCLQACRADTNKGDCGLIPDLEPEIWIPPPTSFGSGKLGKPCERMQREYASDAAYLPVALAPVLPFRVELALEPTCAT